MAGRPGSTFGKRQREQKLIERRQEKSARKEQRKQNKQNGIQDDSDISAAEPGFIFDDLSDDEENEETATEHTPPAVAALETLKH